MFVVKSLHYYPIKSCGGVRADTLQIGKKGPEFDRKWMLVDESGRFLTQRKYPKMALVSVSLDQTTISLTAPNTDPLTFSSKPEQTMREVVVWDDTCRAVEMANKASDWFSNYLGCSCVLVEMHADHTRQVDPRYSQPGEEVDFADGFPVLLANIASLEDLNSKLEAPVLMERFRPNIVIEGPSAFEEDQWAEIRIGSIRFTAPKPSSRCAVVGVDQQTGLRGTEPLKTLSAYRKFGKRIMFGENLIPQGTGRLSVGDPVEILKVREAPHPLFAEV